MRPVPWGPAPLTTPPPPKVLDASERAGVLTADLLPVLSPLPATLALEVAFGAACACWLPAVPPHVPLPQPQNMPFTPAELDAPGAPAYFRSIISLAPTSWRSLGVARAYLLSAYCTEHTTEVHGVLAAGSTSAPRSALMRVDLPFLVSPMTMTWTRSFTRRSMSCWSSRSVGMSAGHFHASTWGIRSKRACSTPSWSRRRRASATSAQSSFLRFVYLAYTSKGFLNMLVCL
mmetsp:Transcript_21667/g.58318  ORF Transcript_21667/g.58318 Transcript_21667/m.58318 type:complete len:232 (+) Transcript_21667:1822-2517(+)